MADGPRGAAAPDLSAGVGGDLGEVCAGVRALLAGQRRVERVLERLAAVATERPGGRSELPGPACGCSGGPRDRDWGALDPDGAAEEAPVAPRRSGASSLEEPRRRSGARNAPSRPSTPATATRRWSPGWPRTSPY
ncbi:unnamed protein product [Prorocentrum cordatum]|uniref:Uncharacterized protein n=1 Tax=Prorocentrum cordatum TaxID=2364126 RepID=A0ABN9XHP6_9DINO|nr:unnamed protein product [Polarella glacialis]